MAIFCRGWARNENSESSQIGWKHGTTFHYNLVPHLEILLNRSRNCSDFPSEAMLWIKEVEMVDSVDEFRSARSIAGKNYPSLDMLDAKIASALKSHFKKKVSLEEQKAHREDRFQRRRQIAFMIYDYFRVTGAHDTVLDCADLFFMTIMFSSLTQDGIKFYFLCQTKIPSDDVLESLYKFENT